MMMRSRRPLQLNIGVVRESEASLKLRVMKRKIIQALHMLNLLVEVSNTEEELEVAREALWL